MSEEHTINIQDLINERNKQDKRIEELVLKLEKQEEVLDKIKEYAQELRFFDNESVEFEISNKILELLEEIE